MSVSRLLVSSLLFIGSTQLNASPQSQCELLADTKALFGTDSISATWLSDSDALAHCQVTGTINQRVSEVDGQTYAIGFEMRLPANWNRRFLMQANGGNDGRVVPALGSFGGNQTPALYQGFAVMSSDAGHKSISGSLLGGSQFAFDPQARLDYGYNAHVALTPIAKSIAGYIYSEEPEHSYFMGCSNGGRQTMVAASRLSAEYDGFVAGNPGFNLPKASIQHAWDIQALSALNGEISKAISVDDMHIVASNILAQCDSLDGLSDGLVSNLMACQNTASIAAMQCSGDNSDSCLALEKITALEKMFSGPTNREGQALYANWLLDAGVGSSNWRMWKVEGPGGLPLIVVLGAGSLANIFMLPPEKIDATASGLLSFLRDFDFDSDANRIYATSDLYPESAMSFMTPPDAYTMQSLQKSGSKLMVYHGASDGVFSANDTINWMQALDQNNNGQSNDFARLFVVPGMGHCGGGPATDRFEMLDAMVQWAEEGIAPDSIIATVNPNNAELPEQWSKERSRLLCPHPQVAWYDSGDIESASSFSCR